MSVLQPFHGKVADWNHARPFLHVLYPRVLLLPGRALAGARGGLSRRLQSRALRLLYVNRLRNMTVALRLLQGSLGGTRVSTVTRAASSTDQLGLIGASSLW